MRGQRENDLTNELIEQAGLDSGGLFHVVKVLLVGKEGNYPHSAFAAGTPVSALFEPRLGSVQAQCICERQTLRGRLRKVAQLNHFKFFTEGR